MASTDGLQHERSFWRGVLFATLTSPLALILVALMTTPRIASPDRVLAGMAVIAVVTMPASLLAITLLGLPVFLLLRRRRWLNWATVCVAAVLTAMLANVVVVAVASAGQTVLTAFIGLVAGVAFCAGAKVVHRLPARRLPGEAG